MTGFRLRAGIIGLGVGEQHIRGYESDRRCRVAVLCDRDPQKLQEVSRRYPGKPTVGDAVAVLQDASIGVVSVASYDSDHRDQVVAALQAGKHVFVEKPLCLTERALVQYNFLYNTLNIMNYSELSAGSFGASRAGARLRSQPIDLK